MTVPLSEKGSTPPITPEQLLAPEGVEALVAVQRIPQRFSTSGSEWLDNQMVGYMIPPEGVQLDDGFYSGYNRSGFDSGIREYVSPEGVSRGFGEIVDISAGRADELDQRIAAARKKLLKSLKSK